MWVLEEKSGFYKAEDKERVVLTQLQKRVEVASMFKASCVHPVIMGTI